MTSEVANGQLDNILDDGLIQLHDAGEKAKVDIVFVHGLRGHPQKTWEGSDANGDSVYWPKELLPSTVPDSRILSFSYPSDFSTFWPASKSSGVVHTNIDDNSTALLVKLGNLRRETTTTNRPIIFVAHSLGGLVVANGLSSQSGSNEERREVVDSTCGTIFLGTPFKGSEMASWAILAERVLSLFGDSNDQTIKGLDTKSKKLQQISFDFHLLLRGRSESKELKPIQVACFFETKKTVWKKKNDIGITVTKNLGLIVTKESASIPGYQPVAIHADHRAMCRFSDVEMSGYRDITVMIKLMTDNWGKKGTSRNFEKMTFNLGDVKHGDNVTNYGIVNGNIVGTEKDAVNQNMSPTFNYGVGRNASGS